MVISDAYVSALSTAIPNVVLDAGDPISSRGVRLLIGLAPTFSLPDLRLADVLNDSLASRRPADLAVDVFDIDDLQQGRLIPAYFPDSGLATIISTPVLGIWENGHLKSVLIGADAVNFVLNHLGVDQTAETLRMMLCPPTADVLDD